MAGTNIYPPIFSRPYMPASIDKDIKIYFSFSMYNSTTSLSNMVQIAIQGQNTNYTALDRDLYPAGIKLAQWHKDETRKADDKFYVQISEGDLEGGHFKKGQFYKVQLRFMQKEAGLPTDNKVTESWLLTNLNYFSQWSQIVLIKQIGIPTITLNDLLTSEVDKTTFTLKDILIAGKITFDIEDNEFLKQYRIYLYDSSNQLVEDSGFKYSNIYSNINEINYKIKYDLQNGNYYTLKIYYMTNNLYQDVETYPIFVDLVQFTILDTNKYSIAAYSKMDSGVIQVELSSTAIINQLGVNFVIRRTSSETNFKIWDDVYTFLAPVGARLNKIWLDRTVQSGVFYKYSFQRRDINNFRSNFLQIPNPIMAMFDDIFLIDDTYQLKVKFDPQITNYSHVVAESSTQTIGSKFPFIRRNGNVNYRTFTLTGTISHFMDTKQNGMKASPTDLYGSNLNLYQSWNNLHNITPYNDSVYERDFRKRVIDFLYENKVKLYKSTTEGNILVKLMNISFTPNNELGRHIYSFTCTAYQVDQFSIENCAKYGILDMGGYDSNSQRIYSLAGQIASPTYEMFSATGKLIEENLLFIPKETITINGQEINYLKEEMYQNRSLDCSKSNYPSFAVNENIVETRILSKYKYLENDLISIDIDYLTSVKIEFTSPPYLIARKDAIYQRISETDETHYPQVFLGHLIKINDTEEPIVVGADGIYELSDDDTKVNNIQFVEQNETGLITYIAHFVQTAKTENIPSAYHNYRKVGQLYDYFLPSESIYKKIFLRYQQRKTIKDKTKSKDILLQRTNMQKLMGVRIMTNPNVMLAIREAQDSFELKEYKKIEIGQTGMLEFYDDETDIRGLYILGPHLVPIPYNETREPREGQYMVYPGQEEFTNFNQIENPKDKCVYRMSAGSEGLMVVISRLSLAEMDKMYRVTAVENEEIIQANTETAYLLQKIIKSDLSCIYYHGGWYAFSEPEGIVYGYPTEAIIDYYCQILREDFMGNYENAL